MSLTPEAGNAIQGQLRPWVRISGWWSRRWGAARRLRLPWSDRLAREGGALSGQALMAAADRHGDRAERRPGRYGPMTTVQQSTTFQRPIVGVTPASARVSKLGRTLAFVDVTMTVDGVVAATSTVYAILG
jgi:acyl-coenzyme A thioesterase PaaI-like protein